jgi:replicative DNA helicase
LNFLNDSGNQAYNLEVERKVLGICLQWPESIDEVADYITKDDWYLETNAFIWQSLIRLSSKGRRIDTMTVSEDLRAHGKLRECGEYKGIENLRDLVPTRAGVISKAKIVAGLAQIRRITDEATKIAIIGRSGEYGEIEEFVEMAEAKITAATQGRNVDDVVSMADIVKQTVGWLDGLKRNKITAFGINTGFGDTNHWTGGLQGGDLIIVAAPTSWGKTALAMQMAVKSEVSTLVCSLEQERKQIALRCLSAQARIPMYKLRNPRYWKEDDEENIRRAANELCEIPIYLDDRARLSPMQIRSRARRLYRTRGLKMIVVDYLQICQPSPGSRKKQNRERDVADISSEFKALAKELDLPVVILSQLNRLPPGQRQRRPVLSRLRESGAIEQDADQVFFIYRPEATEEVKYRESDEPAEIILAKNRNGPCGTVHATWCPTEMRFKDSAYSGPSSAETVDDDMMYAQGNR